MPIREVSTSDLTSILKLYNHRKPATVNHLSKKHSEFSKHYHSSIKYVELLSCRNVDCFGSNLPFKKFVDQPNIGKSSPCHHLIITTTTTVRIEVSSVNPTFHEVFGSWTVFVDATSWWYVISCNAITKVQKAVCIFHSMCTWRRHGHTLKVGWLVNVSWCGIPCIERGWRQS